MKTKKIIFIALISFSYFLAGCGGLLTAQTVTINTDRVAEIPSQDTVSNEKKWCERAFWYGIDPQVDSSGSHTSSPVIENLTERPPIFQLALSGGGYRAMLFHVGTLRRLNDANLLSKISVVSSVSGGSIVAGYLAYRWPDLIFNEDGKATNLQDIIEKPLMELATNTIDVKSAATGFFPFLASGSEQIKKFDKYLFDGAMLSTIDAGIRPSNLVNLAKPPRPLFILNATSLQTGEMWQFRAKVMGGQQTQWTDTDGILLSEAVAASSGFPPFLSPVKIDLTKNGVSHQWYDCSEQRDNPFGIDFRNEPGRRIPVHKLPDFRKSISLLDGGVRDNLGLDALDEINRIRKLRVPQIIKPATATFISDAGQTYELDENPSSFWLSQLRRTLDIIADEPDKLRVSEIVREGYIRFQANLLKAKSKSPASFPPIKCGEKGQNVIANKPSPILERGDDNGLETADKLDVEIAAGKNSLRDGHDIHAYWSIRRLPKLHEGYDCPSDPATWMVEEVVSLSKVPTRMKAMDNVLQQRLINWGYLAAHHGIPYIDFLYTGAWQTQSLIPCQLPFPDIKATNPAKDVPKSSEDSKCLYLDPLFIRGI